MSTKPQESKKDDYNLGQHFDPATAPEQAKLTVRRAPSIPAFAVTGLLIGLLIALIVTIVGPDSEYFTFGAVYGVMAVIFGTLSTAVFITIALVLDRRSTKRLTVFSATSTDD
ncbi:MAG: hypothetical protein Q3965_00485 [Rothia sp. (in: high G+C Gram-positive bacteria)]|nr:hypothetical protein [Rothia sp. (in: high G+C Gram-positive bacteria)]